MKKKFMYIFLFIFTLFLTNTKVEAKVFKNEDVKVTFGDESTLNLAYQSYNQYTLNNDEFYYNGKLYTYSKEDQNKGQKEINGDILVYKEENNEKFLVGSINHDFYAFNIDVEILNNKNYNFDQKICYRYQGVSKCQSDLHDRTLVNKDKNGIRTFYYSFLPFYREDLKFEEIYFELTFTNVSDSSDVIKIDKLGFNINNGEVINYSDYLDLNMINWSSNSRSYNSRNNGKDYLADYCVVFDKDNFVSGLKRCSDNMSISLRSNFLYTTYSKDTSKFNSRNYKIQYEIYVGEDYSIRVDQSKYSLYGLTLTDVVDIFNRPMKVYRKSDFNPFLQTGFDNAFHIDLNFLEYDSSKRTTKYDSFKIKTTYSCIQGVDSDCSDPRSVTNKSQDKIIYLNTDEFKDNSSLLNGEKIEVDNYNSFISSHDKLEYKISVEDNNGIEEVSYYVSDTPLIDYFTNPYVLFENYNFTKINNNETAIIKFDKPGSKFIYLKVKDGSGRIDYSLNNRELCFDNVPPEIVSNNFKSYKSDTPYSKVSLKVEIKDVINIENSKYQPKGYYLIVDESKKGKITTQDVINANNLYQDEVILDKNSINKDGKYLVYFVFIDYLNNSTELIESETYLIDTTPLAKEEIEVNVVEGYSNNPVIKVNINGVDKGVSFKCDLSKTNITDPKELKNQCYNNTSKNIYINDEDTYYLWIYASDMAGNYSLIKFDNPYYIDTIAPRVTTSIIKGDNNVYSNDVEIKVSATDLNDIDTLTTSYQFYLASYDESKFTYFDINNPITYPMDYYGNYKLAIKVCDSVGNCKINTFSTQYLIDTGLIKLTLNGNETITILRYQKFKDPGLTAKKGNNSYASNVSYISSGNVDINTPGEYLITYSAGEGMNKVSITRKVIVKDSLPYIYSIIALFVVGEVVIVARLFIKKRKNDKI